ncbi:hypothetical protein I6N95_18130 [Vagococcus sp. BWB3-3]|uniref:Uncharacterized protein n=1 Tax=Vagococcus allomyrinae TaxID=2794353 RepID=A0A940PG52_9ENTE|nr:hypothetical protein [Vagococcus allomyrinae]MBP1042936.1 hypothetical protein [Vagococcus allomyrinae]
MNGSTTTEQDKITAIRTQYLAKGENKLLQLKQLDRKVKLPAKLTSGVVATGGALLLGAGMSHIMVWENMTTGLTMGIPGLLLALLSIPLYSVVLSKQKKKYTEDIIALSDELLAQD